MSAITAILAGIASAILAIDIILLIVWMIVR